MILWFASAWGTELVVGPDLTYETLAAALNAGEGQGDVTISLASNYVPADEAARITGNVVIEGNGRTLEPVIVSDGTVELRNVTFKPSLMLSDTDCFSTDEEWGVMDPHLPGLCVHGARTEVILSNPVFETAVAGAGVGLLVRSSALVSVDDGTFSAFELRRPVWVTGGFLNITGASRFENDAVGAIGVSNSLLVVDGGDEAEVLFEGSGGTHGGDIWALNSDVRINGAAFLGKDSVTSVEKGGAIYAIDSSLQIDHCAFENHLAWSGGSIYWKRVSSAASADPLLRVANSSFQLEMADGVLTGGDEVGGWGGAIEALDLTEEYSSYVQIADSKFHQNTAERGGGAIHLVSIPHVQILNTEFYQNSTWGAQGRGGALVAVFPGAPQVDLSGLVAWQNSARNGGFAYFGEYSGSPENTELGVILSPDDTVGELQVTESKFAYHEAYRGGVFALGGISAVVLRSEFLASDASEGGGAFWCDEAPDKTLMVRNSVFVNSVDQLNGGGMLVRTGYEPPDVYWVNNTMIDVDSPLWLSAGTVFTFVNNILAYSSPSVLTTSGVLGSDTASVHYNNWYQAESSLGENATNFNPWSELPEVALDPAHFYEGDETLTNYPPSADFHLSEDSLAIGAGDPENWLDANDDPSDLGAFGGEFADQDGDGVDWQVDCDETDPTVYPDAIELCDGIDNDCDGETEEINTYYLDADGDDFGDPAHAVEDCDPPRATYSIRTIATMRVRAPIRACPAIPVDMEMRIATSFWTRIHSWFGFPTRMVTGWEAIPMRRS